MDARHCESALPIAAVLVALVALTALAAILPRAAEQPAVATATPHAAATETPSPSPRPTRTASPTATMTPSPTFTPLPPIIHIVQKGESVGIIAKQYGVSERSVLEANGLEADSIIRIGQELIIPRSTPTPEPAATQAPQGSRPASTPSATGAPALAPGEQTYAVQPGDTLSDIAKKFNSNVNLLMNRNNIKDPSLLRVGQEIIIPAGTPTPLPTPTFRPTSTPTPGPPYGPPVLLWPPDGSVFRGESAVVLVQWASVGLLAPDEWYVVRVYQGGDIVGEQWTKANAWRLPAALRPPANAADHRLTWEVLIMRQEGPEPGKGAVLVAAGRSRYLEWY